MKKSRFQRRDLDAVAWHDGGYMTAVPEMRSCPLVPSIESPGWVEAVIAEVFLPLDVLLPPGVPCTIESGGQIELREECSSAVNKLFHALRPPTATKEHPFIVRLKGAALAGRMVHVVGAFLR